MTTKTNNSKTAQNTISIRDKAQAAAIADQGHTLLSILGLDAEVAIMSDQQMAEDPCYGFDLPPRAFVSCGNCLVVYWDATPEGVDGYGEGYAVNVHHSETCGGALHLENIRSLEELFALCAGIFARLATCPEYQSAHEAALAAKELGLAEEDEAHEQAEDAMWRALEGYLGLK